MHPLQKYVSVPKAHSVLFRRVAVKNRGCSSDSCQSPATAK